MPAPTAVANISAVALAAGGGTAAGVLNMTSTTGWVVGATAFLTGTALPSLRIVIMEIVDATHMTAKILPNLTGDFLRGCNYGLSDFSAYTLAASSKVAQPKQLIIGGDPLFSSCPA